MKEDVSWEKVTSVQSGVKSGGAHTAKPGQSPDNRKTRRIPKKNSVSKPHLHQEKKRHNDMVPPEMLPEEQSPVRMHPLRKRD